LENGSGTLTIENYVGDDINKITISVTWNYRDRNMSKDIVILVTREGINKK